MAACSRAHRSFKKTGKRRIFELTPVAAINGLSVLRPIQPITLPYRTLSKSKPLSGFRHAVIKVSPVTESMEECYADDGHGSTVSRKTGTYAVRSSCPYRSRRFR